MDSWYIWTVKPNKFSKACDYIKLSIPEVRDIFYPTSSRKNKQLPICSNYLFLYYQDSPEVWHRLNSCPYISKFVGACTTKDIFTVDNLVKVQTSKDGEDKYLHRNDKIVISSGPLTGVRGIVSFAKGYTLDVEVEVLERKVRITLSSKDVILEACNG